MCIRDSVLSNETSFGVCSFIAACHKLDVAVPITIQNDFGLLYRTYESELAETCSRRHHNLSLLACTLLSIASPPQPVAPRVYAQQHHSVLSGCSDAQAAS